MDLQLIGPSLPNIETPWLSAACLGGRADVAAGLSPSAQADAINIHIEGVVDRERSRQCPDHVTYRTSVTDVVQAFLDDAHYRVVYDGEDAARVSGLADELAARLVALAESIRRGAENIKAGAALRATQNAD